MTEKDNLRLQAEAKLARAPADPESQSPEGTARQVHELQVHQIELEMQNEELQQARDELKATLEKFTDLYDFAPVGYLTLDHEGAIREVNLAGASLLRIARSALVNRRFGLFVSPADRPACGAFLQKVFESKVRVGCEVTLLLEGSHALDVEMEAIASASGKVCRVALTDITEHKRAEAQIAASLKEKEALLKEIHHRVKNNLQVISSLLSLQSHFIHDPQAREMFRESQDRVELMALIHDKLYQSRDLARIEFGEYIRDLVSMVFHAYRSKSNAITLDLQIDPIFLDIHNAVPVSLILNEMVSNCLKHAFPDGHSGVITIYFKKHPQGQFNLVVRDNGIGVPKDFDLENTASLGLRLIRILARQIGGTLNCCSQGGMEFKVTFSEQSTNERSEP
jgi:two-component sensor histidine kinase